MQVNNGLKLIKTTYIGQWKERV